MTPSILHVDNDINKKSLDFFKKYIIKDNIINKHILISYIGVFDLHLLLKDYYLINKQNILQIENPKIILNLIGILNLQNIYPFKYFIKKKKIFSKK